MISGGLKNVSLAREERDCFTLGAGNRQDVMDYPEDLFAHIIFVHLKNTPIHPPLSGVSGVIHYGIHFSAHNNEREN